jgi:hypothetical protein
MHEVSRPDDEMTQEEALALHDRFESAYKAHFEANPEHDWVMITDKSGEILGGGTDAQTFGEEAFDQMQHEVGEIVHLFGKPIFIEHI